MDHKTEILRFRRTKKPRANRSYYDDVDRVEREEENGDEDSTPVDVVYPAGTHRGGGTGKQETGGQILPSRQIISPSVSINLAKFQPPKPGKLNHLRHSIKNNRAATIQSTTHLPKKYTVKQHK